MKKWLDNLRVWIVRLWEHPPALTEDQQWEQWKKDVERIKTETVLVFRNRLVFRELRETFTNNAQLMANGGFFWRWLFGMYGRDMVLAVGRELDRDTEVVNLIQLMHQIKKHPGIITRKRFLEKLSIQQPAGPNDLRNRILWEVNDKWFTDNMGIGEEVDIALIKQDRNWLEKRCRRVMKYRHKIVAHRTGMELTLTAEHIDEALDAIEKMLLKYYLLFTGGGLMGAEPALQFDWQHIFTYPWITPPPDDAEGI